MIIITQTTPQPPLQVQDGDVVTFRGWYTNSFVASDGVTPVEGGNGQTGFYYEETCSLNDDGFVVIPALSVQPTTGSNPTAGFFGQVLVNGAPVRMIFGFSQATAGWQIPTSPTTTTFGALALYNAAVQLLYPPNTYATYEQVLQAIQEFAGNFLYAAVGIAGITQLTTAPDSASIPIAFGANDPAVGDIHGSLTENKVAKASAEKVLADSLIDDNGVDVGAQTIGAVRWGDYETEANGSRLVVNDTTGAMEALAGGGTDVSPASQRAGIVAECSDSDAEVEVQTTGFSHLYGHIAITRLGDGRSGGNGTMIEINDGTQRIKLTNVPTVNPAVAGVVWSDGGTLKISAG